MNDEHLDAKIIALGFADEQFAADFDRIIEQEPSDLEELRREDDRLFEEGRRLRKAFAENRPNTLEGVSVLARAIGHRNRWAGKTPLDRVREAETTEEVCMWQLIAVLPELLEQAGFVPRALLTERAHVAA